MQLITKERRLIKFNEWILDIEFNIPILYGNATLKSFFLYFFITQRNKIIPSFSDCQA